MPKRSLRRRSGFDAFLTCYVDVFREGYTMTIRRTDFLAAGSAAAVSLLAAPAGAAGTGAAIIALYKAPADPAAFDKYYFTTHVPIAKTLPGLQSFTVGKPLTAPSGPPPPYYMVARLEFQSVDALNSALGSPQGKATVGDLKNFASAGVDVLTFGNVVV
jgi:uncharacterized protein (TIGR02118 family)